MVTSGMTRLVAALLLVSTSALATTASLERWANRVGRDPAAVLTEMASQPLTADASAEARAERHLLAGEAHLLLTRGREALNEADAGLALIPVEQGAELPLTPLSVRLQILRAGALDLLGKAATAQPALSRLLERLEASTDAPPQLLTEALAMRGTLSLSLLDLPAALTDLQRAYQLAPANDPRMARADVAGIIANLYAEQADTENALRYYQEAIRYFQQTDAGVKLSVAVYGIGTMYRDRQNWPEARRYFGWSLDLSRQRGDVQGVAYAEQQLAHVAIETGQLAEAQGLLDAAQPLFEQAEDHAMVINTLISRADLAGERREFGKAMQFLQQAELLAKQHQLQYVEHQIWLRRSDLYAEQKNFADAYDAFRMFHQTQAELFRSESERQLQELRVKFDSERQQQQNELLRQQNALQEAALQQQRHRLWLYVAVAMLSLLATAFLLYVIYKGRQLRQRLDALAHTDELTGLPNRRHLMQEAQLEVERARRYDLPLCLAVLDLDHFKQINDRFGHAVGDEVLRQFAQLCKRLLRQTDVMGRIGGEEFVLLLPHTRLAVASQILERLRHDFRQLEWSQLGNMHQPTVSVGLTTLTSTDAGLAELMRRADEALYAAKAAGRDQLQARERPGANATGGDMPQQLISHYEKY